MDFALGQELEAFRREVREFIRTEAPPQWQWSRYAFDHYSHDDATERFARAMAAKLGKRGWLSLTWPEEHGGKKASPLFQLALAEELEYRGCPGVDIFGVGMIAPTLLRFASEEQKREHLPGIASGTNFWCECLSEPGAGSDLASLGTQAVEHGDDYVVNGQKVWTSGAHRADWCILLARTDRELPRHKGVSFFLVNMKTPGITVRPLINMAGDHESNEVYFDGVRVPGRNLIGGKNRGWPVVLGLLDFERATAVPFYVVARHYLEVIARHAGRAGAPRQTLRRHLADLAVQCEIGRLLAYRAAWLQGEGQPFDTEAAKVKLYTVELNQRVAAAGMEALGLHGGLLEGSKQAPLDGRAPWYYLRSIGNTLEAGASEIDRDIIASRGLGLPRG
ncbi:MAG: acyl-CoA dehydrogenase family protein [Chloroflexi bacterium]|nr:acyl-CoA dehydrogenase family protein [Chloroflexota bacterium]